VDTELGEISREKLWSIELKLVEFGYMRSSFENATAT
jgi:hypothetical protein